MFSPDEIAGPEGIEYGAALDLMAIMMTSDYLLSRLSHAGMVSMCILTRAL